MDGRDVRLVTLDWRAGDLVFSIDLAARRVDANFSRALLLRSGFLTGLLGCLLAGDRVYFIVSLSFCFALARSCLVLALVSRFLGRGLRLGVRFSVVAARLPSLGLDLD